jgi:hypothetical protein
LNHDDPVGKAPYISLGLGLPENKPIDPESGHKNKHDIKVQARDIIHAADRDDRTGAGRHILELAISDIVRQAYANIEDIATEYIRIQSHPDTGSDVSQFGTQFYDPAESAFVHPDDPSQHSTKSIWESTFSDDISKIKMSAHETLILQSRRADIHMSTGKIGDLNTFNDASPPESSEGDDIGRNILAEASNGVVIEAFVRTDSEVAGSGDYQSAKAIHLFHRGPDLPHLSTSNPPIEVGRRWENGVGSNRYLHPNGEDDVLGLTFGLPVNKTFHRLLDERAAVSFNRHLHPFEFEIQTAEQDVPIEGSFQLTPTWGPPWDGRGPGPTPNPTSGTTVPVSSVPGYLTPSGLHVLPPDGDDPLYSGAAGDGVASNTSIAPPVDPYSAATAGGVSGGGAFGMSGDGSSGMAGGPPPGDGAGMAPEGMLGSPAAVQGLRGSIPAPPPHQSTGWAPFNTAAGEGGFLGTLAAIAGTDATPGALGQIGKTLDVILNYLECNHCFEWDTEVTGSENTGFSEFGARWWDPIQEPIEIMVPETGGNSIANSPVYLTNSGVMATTPPVNYSGRQSNPFSPDPQLGGTAAGDPRHYTFGNPVLPDPKYSEYDVLDFGVEYEMEALSQDLGSTALRRMLGPLFGTFQSSVIVPSQTLSWEGDTGPPIAPDRWVPTYHTPEDAWGTSVPGVITGPIPYPGALEEGSIPCMTEFTRAN